MIIGISFLVRLIVDCKSAPFIIFVHEFRLQVAERDLFSKVGVGFE